MPATIGDFEQDRVCIISFSPAHAIMDFAREMQGQTERFLVLPEPAQRKSTNVLPREFKARAAPDLCCSRSLHDFSRVNASVVSAAPRKPR
jgi:hypothetical protein